MAEHVGGQAVIDGVMMRYGKKVAIAVRKPDGKISVKKQGFASLKERFAFLRFPFVRGVVSLYEDLSLGIKSLFLSAEEAVDDGEKISKREIFFSVALAVVFALLLFVALPFYLTTLITAKQSFIFNLVDGLIRIAMFFVYLLIISQMRDIKVMFRYHGAEHKAVNAYEDKKPLTIGSVRKYSTLNLRCGTSFLLIVLVVAVLFFSFVPSSGWLLRVGARVVLLPVIAGVSYELLKLSHRFGSNRVVKLVAAPGMLLQKITTKEPDDKQIETAIAALNAVL